MQIKHNIWNRYQLFTLLFAAILFCDEIYATEDNTCSNAVNYLQHNTFNTSSIQLAINTYQKSLIVDNTDPISINESPMGKEHMDENLEYFSEPIDGYQGVYCVQILVAFSVSKTSADKESFLRPANSKTHIFRATLFKTISSIEEENSFKIWKKQLYNIPVYLNQIGSESLISVLPTNFEKVLFFGEIWKGDDTNVIFKKKTNYSDPFTSLVSTSSNLTNIVLCSTHCDYIFNLLKHTERDISDQSQFTSPHSNISQVQNNENIATAISEDENQENKTETEVVTDLVNDTKSLPLSDESASGNTGATAESPHSSTNADSIYPEFSVQLVGRTSTGQPIKKAVIEEFGLHCVIQALDLDLNIFAKKLDCNQKHLDSIRTSRSRIEIDSDGRWVLQQIPKSTNLDIRVLLPAGIKGSACALLVKVQHPDMEDYVKTAQPDQQTYEPQPAFRVTIPTRYVHRGETLDVELIPYNAADCGGSKRSLILDVTTAVDGEILVPLVDELSTNYALNYIFVPNKSSSETELGLSEDDNYLFGRDMVESVFAALNRSAVFSDDSPRTINRVTGTLIGHSSPVTIFDLDSDRLTKNDDLSISNLRINDDVTLLSSNSFPFRQDGVMGSEISEQSRKIAEQGFNRIRSIVLGLILNNSASVPPDPCKIFSDSFKRDLDGKSNSREEELDIFPIIKLKTSDKVDATTVVPVSVNTIAPTSVGGLYRCKSLSEPNVNIFPFYVEHWRKPSDVLPRFKVALTDQLYRFIEDIEND